jgi:predicted dehydrogenase
MLAEAFMFPWHPQAAAIRQTLARGVLGDPRVLALTFCFPHLQADNFRYDPALGGGAWLDHACYLVKALDCYFPGDWRLLGGRFEQDGYAVDVRGAAQLRRVSDGLIANLAWGFGHSYVNELQVLGTRGRMLVESAFTKPASRGCDLTLEESSGQRITITPERGDAFASMFAGFARYLRRPASWAEMRQEILRHGERFFALRAQLQANSTVVSQDLSHAE